MRELQETCSISIERLVKSTCRSIVLLNFAFLGIMRVEERKVHGFCADVGDWENFILTSIWCDAYLVHWLGGPNEGAPFKVKISPRITYCWIRIFRVILDMNSFHHDPVNESRLVEILSLLMPGTCQAFRSKLDGYQRKKMLKYMTLSAVKNWPLPHHTLELPLSLHSTAEMKLSGIKVRRNTQFL